ncbi:MAG: prepilin-type N-terminal cleavage/methylation domain-containing protein [Haliea sp.]|nr:prepilin-type N-terminal cleavage/methylation domain-containing protein [Haliea sp.]
MTANTARMHRPIALRQNGLTMMELLVTVAILSLLIAGLSQLVVTNSQNASATGALARIADTGRTAMQILAADTRRAGYPGGYDERLRWGLTLPNQAGLGATTMNPPVLQRPPTGRAGWISLFLGLTTRRGLRLYCDADAEGQYVRGDVLTLRYAPTPPIDVANKVANKPYLRVTVGERRLFFGSDANDADNVPERPPWRDYNLAAHTYFVGATGRTCQGSEIPALFRMSIGADGLPVSQELLAGVENLQLRYLVGNRYYDADEGPLTGTALAAS